MQKISIVYITLNEERNIGRSLEVTSLLTDDIVVLDSGSTDRTEEICRSYPNVSFHSTVWKGYSETKNQANTLAKYDYILSLDADEIPSKELIKSIREKLVNNNLEGAYYMNRLTNYCGSWIRHCGWYPDSKIRLWNRNEGKWDGDLHEKIVFSVLTNISFLKGDILHYSYYNVNEHLKQFDRYTTIGAQIAFEKGKKASVGKLIFSAPVKFFKDYIIKLGFLDGYAGFQVSKMSAFASYLKYAKLRDLHRLQKSQEK